jgi:hypothetical protein
MTPAWRQLSGSAFSRVSLVVKRSQDDERIMELVRRPDVPPESLPYAIKYRKKAAALPVLPPSKRTNRRGHNDIFCPPREPAPPSPMLAPVAVSILFVVRAASAPQPASSP